MTTPRLQPFTDAQRMELRSYVQLAGEAIAQYWPMRTFIHHNPLHGLEALPFDEAVKRGAHLFGGRGYLHNEIFRGYLQQGASSAGTCAKPLPPRDRQRSHVWRAPYDPPRCADRLHEPRGHRAVASRQWCSREGGGRRRTHRSRRPSSCYDLSCATGRLVTASSPMGSQRLTPSRVPQYVVRSDSGHHNCRNDQSRIGQVV